MSRAYYQNHKAKKLKVNFNQKQWRQDFADFVKNRLSWISETVVTRPKAITKGVNLYHKGIKYFEIQNAMGDSVYVEFQHGNEITNTTFPNLAEDYLKAREIN